MSSAEAEAMATVLAYAGYLSISLFSGLNRASLAGRDSQTDTPIRHWRSVRYASTQGNVVFPSQAGLSVIAMAKPVDVFNNPVPGKPPSNVSLRMSQHGPTQLFLLSHRLYQSGYTPTA